MKRKEKQKKQRKKQKKNSKLKRNEKKEEFSWSETKEIKKFQGKNSEDSNFEILKNSEASLSSNSEILSKSQSETLSKSQSEILSLPSMEAWKDLLLPETILKALQELHFNKPTEIQEMVLPPAIRDHQDIIAAAETVRYFLKNSKINIFAVAEILSSVKII